jgi:hypothetical protein
VAPPIRVKSGEAGPKIQPFSGTDGSPSTTLFEIHNVYLIFHRTGKTLMQSLASTIIVGDSMAKPTSN